MRRHNRKAEGRVPGLDSADTTPGPGAHTTRALPSEQDIRVRAYHLWERDGRPPGDGVGFWLAAERDLRVR